MDICYESLWKVLCCRGIINIVHSTDVNVCLLFMNSSDSVFVLEILEYLRNSESSPPKVLRVFGSGRQYYYALWTCVRSV